MTTANKITLVRIVLIPVFLVLAYLGHTWWALGVYIVACISDTVDGYIARRYKQVTDFGKFIDPLADKMLVLAAMVYFVEIGVMPGWAVAVVLFREFAVSGLRMIAVGKGRVIAAAWTGKVKTFSQMILILVLFFLGWKWNENPFVLAGSVWVAFITLFSGVQYFMRNGDALKS